MQVPASLCAVSFVSTITNSSNADNYRSGIYSLPERLMEAMIGSADNRFVKHITLAYRNLTLPKQQLISREVFYNMSVVFVVDLSMLLSLATLTVCIILCESSIVTEKRTVKGSIACGLICLSMSICFTIAGILLYGNGIKDLHKNSDTVDEVYRSSLDDVRKFIMDSFDILRCYFNIKSNKLKNRISTTTVNASFNLAALKKLVANKNIDLILQAKKNTVERLDQLDTVLNISNMTSANVLMLENANVRKALTVWQQVDKSTLAIGDSLHSLLQRAEDSLKKSNDALDSYMMNLNDSITVIINNAEKLQMIAENVRRENDFVDPIKSYLILLIVPAAIQAVLGVIGLIILVLRGIFHRANNFVVTIGISILDGSAYASMTIMAILFITFAFCFVLAYSSSYLCLGLTTNGDLGQLTQIDTTAKNDGYLMKKDNTDRFDIINILKECHAGSSIFETTYNLKNWNAERLMTKQSLLIEISRMLSNLVTSDDDSIEELMDSVNRYRMAFNSLMNGTEQNPGIQSPLETQLQRYAISAVDELLKFTRTVTKSMTVLSLINSKNQRDNFINHFNNSIASTSEESIVSYLNIQSPRCAPITALWTRIGDTHCSSTSVPVQWLWPAILICVSGSLFLYFGIWKAIYFLQPIVMDSRRGYDIMDGRRRKHKKKQKFEKNSKEVKNSKKLKPKQKLVKVETQTESKSVTMESKGKSSSETVSASKEGRISNSVSWEIYKPSQEQSSWKVYHSKQKKVDPSQMPAARVKRS